MKKLKLSFKLSQKAKTLLIVFLTPVLLGLFLFSFKDYYFAAIVNNRPITRHSLDRELEKQGGRQVLEGLITEILILQEAKEQKVEISQEEIEAKMGEIETQVTSQGSDLDTLLEAQGQTRQDLEEQIEVQLIVEKIVDKDVVISEEELENYFEENKEFLAEGATFEEIKEDLRESLRQEKISNQTQAWLEGLKQKAKIYYLLEF